MTLIHSKMLRMRKRLFKYHAVLSLIFTSVSLYNSIKVTKKVFSLLKQGSLKCIFPANIACSAFMVISFSIFIVKANEN